MCFSLTIFAILSAIASYRSLVTDLVISANVLTERTVAVDGNGDPTQNQTSQQSDHIFVVIMAADPEMLAIAEAVVRQGLSHSETVVRHFVECIRVFRLIFDLQY